MTFQHLGEEFWESPSPADFDGRTVLKRIRADLSRNLSAPITVPEVWARGHRHGLFMLRDPEHFERGECARPLAFVAKVWGVVSLGLPERVAANMALFLADHAGGDAMLGGPEGSTGKILKDLWRQYGGGGLGPEETSRFLDDKIRALKKG
jgi:hypothetical protein